MKRHFISIILISCMTWSLGAWAETNKSLIPNTIESVCSSHLKNEDLIKSTQKVIGTEHVLKRIVGRVRTDFTTAGRPTAEFYSEKDIVQRRKSGSGEALIQILSNHANPDSPTALRVEEKAVIHNSQLQEFFAQSQAPEFATNYNSGNGISWSQRDVPRGGHNFTTITEYGQHMVFELGGNPSTFIVKPRFRKYYEFAEANSQDIDSYKSVLGDLTAVELKITTTSGTGSDKFLDTEDTVFKPRIMVTDAIADALKKLKPQDAQFFEQLNQLKKQIQELRNNQNELVNESDKVASFVEALRWLLMIDPQFLQTEFVVKYERSSFRLRTQGREYQFTADQKVSIYSAEPKIATNQLQNYLTLKPIFQSNPEEVFVELKSPVADKQNKSPLYIKLIELMEKNHLVNYKKGSGKYAIARYVDQGLQDKHMDRTLLDQGVKYWLIKGASNLDALPKKNDFLTQGEIEVAFPFTTKTGHIFRVLFRYRSTKQFNGNPRIGVLDKIKIFDNYGTEIKTNYNVDSLIWQTNNRSADQILGLELDGNIVPFKTHLTAKDISEYNDFFLRYYQYQTDLRGRARNLEDLDRVNSQFGLSWKSFKLKAENMVHFLIDRTKRVAIGALVTVSVVAGYDYVKTDYLAPPPSIAAQQAPVKQQVLTPPLMLTGLYHEKSGQVQLVAHQDQYGGFYFTLPKGISAELASNSIFELKDSSGATLQFIVLTLENGEKRFLLRDRRPN